MSAARLGMLGRVRERRGERGKKVDSAQGMLLLKKRLIRDRGRS